MESVQSFYNKYSVVLTFTYRSHVLSTSAMNACKSGGNGTVTCLTQVWAAEAPGEESDYNQSNMAIFVSSSSDSIQTAYVDFVMMDTDNYLGLRSAVDNGAYPADQLYGQQAWFLAHETGHGFGGADHYLAPPPGDDLCVMNSADESKLTTRVNFGPTDLQEDLHFDYIEKAKWKSYYLAA